MSRLLFIALLLPLAAVARPWNSITPGTSTTAEVLKKFGEPSKKVEQRGKEVLVYMSTRAIRGTVQAQFKADPKTGVVERIDVYPEPIIEKQAMEESYGPWCDAEGAGEPCYQRRDGDGKKRYVLYVKLGLAVFFKADGLTVQSFAFLPEKP